jgi:hypothetical protein
VSEQSTEGKRFRCEVCGREEETRLLQSCFECGADFHLNPRNDVDGIDCGDAWIGESLGVHFYCQRCIDRMDAETRGVRGDPSYAQAGMMPPGMAGPGLSPPPMPEMPPQLQGEQGPPPRRARPERRRRYRRIDGQ